jgi:hypothetical protein
MQTTSSTFTDDPVAFSDNLSRNASQDPPSRPSHYNGKQNTMTTCDGQFKFESESNHSLQRRRKRSAILSDDTSVDIETESISSPTSAEEEVSIDQSPPPSHVIVQSDELLTLKAKVKTLQGEELKTTTLVRDFLEQHQFIMYDLVEARDFSALCLIERDDAAEKLESNEGVIKNLVSMYQDLQPASSYLSSCKYRNDDNDHQNEVWESDKGNSLNSSNKRRRT